MGVDARYRNRKEFGPVICTGPGCYIQVETLLNEIVKTVQANGGSSYGDEHSRRSADDGADDQCGTANDHQGDILSGAKPGFSFTE